MPFAMTIVLKAKEPPAAVAAAAALAGRLRELGCKSEMLDEAAVKSLGGIKSVGAACALLTRNGIFVVAACEKLRPAGEWLPVELDLHDTPEFAAEKVLDELAAKGALALDDRGYSVEDEEKVRERLSQLGYIE